VLLHYYAPDNWDRYAERPVEEVEQRLAELELTVTVEGSTRDIEVVSDAGDPRLGQQTVRAAENARYRPRFADGEPVESSGIRFVQPFFVLRAEPAVSDAAAPGPGTEPEPQPAGGSAPRSDSGEAPPVPDVPAEPAPDPAVEPPAGPDASVQGGG
jgi:hypothetical protein